MAKKDLELTEEIRELRKPYEGIKGVQNIWKPLGDREYEDLSGRKFGRLTAVKAVGRNHRGYISWLCECECSNKVIVLASNLKIKHTSSCGCLANEAIHRRRTEVLTGKTFGYWTVIEDKGGNKCLCRCRCGTVKEVDRNSLKIKDSLSCGCKHKENLYEKATKKMVGKKFGRLTVIKRVEDKGKQAYYLCKCDCGNEKVIRGSHIKSGLIKSCGCYNKERIHETQFKNLVGKKIGRLEVLEISERVRDDKGNYTTMYHCRCDCGNEITINGKYLRGKCPTLSCGCLHKEVTSEAHLIDLSGMKFGKLTVIKRAENTPGGETRYLCKCECGGEVLVMASNLKSNQTISCGCVKSKGEYLIAKLLDENNIIFQKQKTFEDLKGAPKGVLRYDFYISEGNYIIEYDGIQHFKAGSGWDTEEHVKKTQTRDNIKNEYCKKNNIPLIRIPYTHFEDLCIDDLRLETSKFVIN